MPKWYLKFLWVFCIEYQLDGDEIVEMSGSSGPVWLDYPNELSYFDIQRFTHKSPGDGASYSKDIRMIFPKNIQDKILKYKGQQDLHDLLRQRILLEK